MKRINRVIAAIVGITLFAGIVGFTSEQLSQEQVDAIVDDIPKEWHHGGWDKMADLKSVQARFATNTAVSARAQYYIASQLYANRDHQRAVEEYQKLIINYPTAWLECQKAQFEIGQIQLYRLDKPVDAIQSAQKAIQAYPDSMITPKAQLLIARAYRRLRDDVRATGEYKKLVSQYTQYNREVTEGHLDLGHLFLGQAFAGAEAIGPANLKLKEAVSAYKKAYATCDVEDVELMKQAIDGIYRSLKAYDGNVDRANSFVLFQQYGTAGQDRLAGTQDDLVDPLKAF